jgi:hypothetical protein
MSSFWHFSEGLRDFSHAGFVRFEKSIDTGLFANYSIAHDFPA